MANRAFKEELQRVLPGPKVLFAWFVMAAAFVWFYWSSVTLLVYTWWRSEDYQHGFFVPIFAVLLLWLRRDMIVPFTGRVSWWGLPLLALWAAMRWLAVYFNYGSLPELSMLPFFAGLALFVGGGQGLRWSWPAILFLFFMIPLPGAMQGALSQQLQGLAARLSLFVIQTLGIPAVAQGHIIQVSNAQRPLDVAEACSGLRMMTLFFAICVGAAFVVRKPLWEKLVMVASAFPIAVASNVVRIVLTAVLCEAARHWPSLMTEDTAEKFMHDTAGLLMMPVGLLLLWAEMTVISKLLIAPLPERPLMVGEFRQRKRQS
jgi:exosortase